MRFTGRDAATRAGQTVADFKPGQCERINTTSVRVLVATRLVVDEAAQIQTPGAARIGSVSSFDELAWGGSAKGRTEGGR